MAKATRLARELKTTYTADNGVSDLRPILGAYDGDGRLLVSVLMASLASGELGMTAAAIGAAWQPWAMTFISEAYVRVVAELADAPEHGSLARAFADGDLGVYEAVLVQLHHRDSDEPGCLAATLPFSYLTGHTIEWKDPGPWQNVGEVGGRIYNLLHAAVSIGPPPGIGTNEARGYAIELIENHGHLVAMA